MYHGEFLVYLDGQLGMPLRMPFFPQEAIPGTLGEVS